METAKAVVAVPTIVPASNNTTAAKSTTNAINVNQSDSNSHTHIINGSGNSSTNATSSSNSNVNSSNSNSSSSSCSTSSNSSGYGSTTTTPTNNYETHQQQHTPTPTRTSTTPIAIAEPIIPVATVAAVTPYYNEAITTHNLEIQHQHQQQQQQQYHHQQHQQQHHLQQSFQHHQYLQRQQYYGPYDYQQQTPNLSTTATYNLSSGVHYDISSPTPSASGAYVGGQYKSSGLSGINYDRNAVARPTTAASSLYTQQVQNEEQPKTVQNLQLHQQQFTKQRNSASLITSSNTAGSKPQATATPFYAQPLSQHSNPASFYDHLKHKIPLEYHDTYTNPTSATYHQQQKYYAAAKSQLKEATYGTPGLGSKSLYSNTTNFYTGSTVNPGYDKYMYPHATANAYSSTGHLANETPPDTSYRKSAVANTLSSPSWPWGIDYASGNSRTIPPPVTHLPTATVAPTHATYLTPNPSALSRDPYYMHHDKFNVKYDKYSASACPPPYQQPYASPPATRHQMWPSSHGPQLTQLNDRHHFATGPTAPPPHTLHSSPYFPTNSGSSLSARQSCYSQPYQPQNCYYPTPNRLPLNQAAPPVGQSAAYMSGQQPNCQSSHLTALASSCKYSGVMTENGSKLKNPNDLYVTSHYDTNNASPLNYGYGSNQMFNPNAHQSLTHSPSAALTHDSLAVNPASYINDLNLTTSNFENYPAHHHDSHLIPAPLGPMHSQQQQPPQYAPTVGKRALLDYRKPIQPQPPPIGQEECYTTLTTTSRNQYNQQELLNTPETTSAFSEYVVNQEVASITYNDTSEAIRETEKANEEENKNLSLRDFIANWNDDEDEYNNTEDLNFEETSAVINEVLQATPNEHEPQVTEMEDPEALEIFKSVPLKNVPKPTDSFPTDSIDEVDSSQCVNLPDIIIDIEKSNNANNSIASSLSTPTPALLEEDTNTTLTLNNFDVEKELDQLKMLKDEEKFECAKDLNDIKESCVTTPQIIPCKVVTPQLSFDDLNLELPTKTVTTSITTRAITSQSNTNDMTTEQYFKDIEGYESGNSRHSNESAFEKEYETFINKITSESTSKSARDSIKASPDTESDFEQNVQDFSKFYKRKRKLKEDELKSSTVVNQNTKKLKSNSVEIVHNSNFPQVYTKKSRNRQLKVKQHMPRKRKPSSVYYKIIHSLRRYRLFRIKRVRDYITELKEKHLPLIKRQSIKNYSHSGQENLFSPNSLKALSILAINTEEFRQRIMLDIEKTTNNCLASNIEHICTDSTCETCEVIKSLMEPECLQNAEHNQESVDLYEITEDYVTTSLPSIPEDLQPIVVATDVESYFETEMVDSFITPSLLEVLGTEKLQLLTTSNENSLNTPVEESLLILEKSQHLTVDNLNSPQDFLSISNSVETKPKYLISPTPPIVESSLESKSLSSSQQNDLEVCEGDQIDIENRSDLEESAVDHTENVDHTDLEVVSEKVDFECQPNMYKNTNIDLNTKDNPMNLKMSHKYREELKVDVCHFESRVLRDAKLLNQSPKLVNIQSESIEDNELFENTSQCLKSDENVNANENFVEPDFNTNVESESQNCDKSVKEYYQEGTTAEVTEISSNSEKTKGTCKSDHLTFQSKDDNNEDLVIKTNSIESIKYVQDEKDDSEDSDSSESDSESSSDSSDESTDDNKGSQVTNTDEDSSSDSDSDTESEDENSLDSNLKATTVSENIVDSTKKSESKNSWESPIKLNNVIDTEIEEDNPKQIANNSQTTLTENIFRIAIKDSNKPLELKIDSDSEWNDESDDENIESISESGMPTSCNSSLKLIEEVQQLTSIKSFQTSTNPKLCKNDSKLVQSSIENISKTLIDNEVETNKIKNKLTTQLDDEYFNVNISDNDSNYDYESETDDDDYGMECNRRWKYANDTSQVIRASQTLLQTTLELLHTTESSLHESNISQTNQQTPLDFLKSAKYLEEESKTNSIVISDDETIEISESIGELPTENLQTLQDRQEFKTNPTVISDIKYMETAENTKPENNISMKTPEYIEQQTNIFEAEKSEDTYGDLSRDNGTESLKSNFVVDDLLISETSDAEKNISTQTPEYIEQHTKLFEEQKSEDTCEELGRDNRTESLKPSFVGDGLNENENKSQLQSDMSDSENNFSMQTPEYIEQHTKLFEDQKSEDTCGELRRDNRTESLKPSFVGDGLNENENKSQLQSDMSDSENNFSMQTPEYIEQHTKLFDKQKSEDTCGELRKDNRTESLKPSFVGDGLNKYENKSQLLSEMSDSENNFSMQTPEYIEQHTKLFEKQKSEDTCGELRRDNRTESLKPSFVGDGLNENENKSQLQSDMSDSENNFSMQTPEYIEQHTKLFEEQKSKDTCGELRRNNRTESLKPSFVGDGLNEIEKESQLLSEVSDSDNSSCISTDSYISDSVEANITMKPEILPKISLNVNKVEAHSCKELMAELSDGTRNKISSKDLSAIEELNLNDDENIIFDLSVTSLCVTENISVKKEVTKINLVKFQLNEEVSKTLPQETTTETSIESISVKYLTATLESPKPENEEDKDIYTLEDTKLDACTTNEITETSTSNEKNIFKYNFSSEFDSSNTGLNRQTDIIKPIECSEVHEVKNVDTSENLKTKNLTAKTTKNCTNDSNDESFFKKLETEGNKPILNLTECYENVPKPIETKETTTKFNEEHEEQLKEGNFENEEKSHECANEILHSPQSEDAVTATKTSEHFKTYYLISKTNAESLQDNENKSYEDDKSDDNSENVKLDDKKEEICSKCNVGYFEYSGNQNITDNLMEIIVKRKILNEFEQYAKISESENEESEINEHSESSEILKKSNIKNCETSEYRISVIPGDSIAEPIKQVKLNTNEFISESLLDKSMLDKSVSEYIISDSEEKKLDIFEENVLNNTKMTENRFADIIDEEFVLNDNILENTTKINSNLETRVDESESESSIKVFEKIIINDKIDNLEKIFSKSTNKAETTDEESELNAGISEPSRNECEVNFIENEFKIIVTAQEPFIIKPILNEVCSESNIDEQTFCNESEQNNTTSEVLIKEFELNKTMRDHKLSETTTDSFSELTNKNPTLVISTTESELNDTTADEESELNDGISELSCKECEANTIENEFKKIISEDEPFIIKPVLNEVCSESNMDDPTFCNESEQNNTNSDVMIKEFDLDKTIKDHTFSETNIDSFSELTNKNQTIVILTTESELNNTTADNRTSEIFNEEPKLNDSVLESTTEDMNSENKESELNNICLESTIEDPNGNNLYNNLDSDGKISENLQPDFADTVMDKESTTEDISGDFFGFKNQSSFEDESGDFHGFEDIEEERRIRREIENINEDSAANDGFFILKKETHSSSKTSLAGSTTTEINELEALEKELSQHQVDEKNHDEDEIETDTNLIHTTNEIISTNDIEHIKKMLESDEEPQQEESEYHRSDDKMEAIKMSKDVSELPDSSREVLKPECSIIPKLSDLCRAALNSSLHVNNLTVVQNVPDQTTNDDTATTLVEHELTVEEALAEMYRQAGVLLSDPEDCDNDTPKTTTYYNEEAQDVLLINLQEILNSDNDVYVLQCDMNENILNVVQETNDNDNYVNANIVSLEQNTERVNTLQFIGILDTEASETQIHIISSDSESEVIILSDDEDESGFEPILSMRHERVTIPFINDSDFNNDSLSDISTIHHEEIVPENLNKFLQEEFYKYLHEKYVQRNISKYFYANRVLKKYRNRFVKKSRQ